MVEISVLAYVTYIVCDIVFFLMIRRPPRSTLDRSSAASDVYKRQHLRTALAAVNAVEAGKIAAACSDKLKIPERIHAARVSAVKQALNAVSYTHLTLPTSDLV